MRVPGTGLGTLGAQEATGAQERGFDVIQATVNSRRTDDLIAEFLTTASDAVVLAGSPAVHQLGLDVGTLLVMCAQQPRMAFEVLAQTTPRGACLSGVAPQTLLETGLTVRQLRELGYTREALAAQTCAGDVELGALGF